MNEENHNVVDSYIGQFEGVTRERLVEVRRIILDCLPDATELISYAIPCFKRGKHSIVFIAGYKKHIGVYPMPEGDDAFREMLAPFASGASTARFPHLKPLPVELIKQIVRFRVEEMPST